MSMSSQVAENYEPREGKVARMIDRGSTRLPTDVFLVAAGASVIGALALQISTAMRGGRFGLPTRGGQLSLFIGQWAPTFLMLGLYNKMVKIAQSEGRLTR